MYLTKEAPTPNLEPPNLNGTPAPKVSCDPVNLTQRKVYWNFV